MKSIENEAIQTYQKNRVFFEKEHPDVYKQLTFFESNLQNTPQNEQYSLEYINGYFDVKELSSSQFLYASNSINVSQQLTDQINFKKDSYTFEGFPIYHSGKSDLNALDDKTYGIQGIFPIMNYYIDHEFMAHDLKEINKFMFIGIGLGLHLPLIHKKIKAKEYLIIEDDLELFRLSLFTLKYYELAKDSKLTFSVEVGDNDFSNLMDNFLKKTFYNNRYLKYSYFPAHSNSKIKQIQNSLSKNSFVTFPYKTSLRKILRPLEYINDGYRVLNLSKHFQDGLFSRKPVLLLTAGPSFQKNIDFLRANHKRFILVAVSATLKTLYQEGIKPDVVTHIDGFEASEVHYNSIDTKEFLKDTIIILGPFVPMSIRTRFNKEQVYSYEESTEYFQRFGSIVAPCIGSFSTLMLLIFNTKELYLLGLDLALDSETGSTHSGDHAYNTQMDLSNSNELSYNMGLRKTILNVSGNFAKTVPTTPLFQSSLQALFNAIPKLKKEDQLIYNLNNGANINQTLTREISHIPLENYEVLDKDKLFSEIQTLLNQHSSIRLNKDNAASMKQRGVCIREIETLIKKYERLKSFANFDLFLYELLGLISAILHKESRECQSISKIYDDFFKYVLPLVMDIFNSKEIKNSKKHINTINEMVIKELKEIKEIYKEAIEDFIETRL